MGYARHGSIWSRWLVRGLMVVIGLAGAAGLVACSSGPPPAATATITSTCPSGKFTITVEVTDPDSTRNYLIFFDVTLKEGGHTSLAVWQTAGELQQPVSRVFTGASAVFVDVREIVPPREVPPPTESGSPAPTASASAALVPGPTLDPDQLPGLPVAGARKVIGNPC